MENSILRNTMQNSIICGHNSQRMNLSMLKTKPQVLFRKDIEEIKPIVEETNAAYSKLTSLSNDELRARSQELRKTIHAHYAEEQKEVDDLKTKTQDDDALSIEDKEAAISTIIWRII